MRRPAWVLVLVEAARCISGPGTQAVVEMGSPPTGLPALVERRREHRVTGVCPRTESRSLETRRPNATGSRQTSRSAGTQRVRNARTNPSARGLANQGNREVCHDIENKSSCRTARADREYTSPALRPSTAPSRRREALPRWRSHCDHLPGAGLRTKLVAYVEDAL